MHQYALLLTQNSASSGIEFVEKEIVLADKELLVGGADGALAKITKADAAGKILKATNADGTFSWQTNDGTVNDTFQIGVDGAKLKKSGSKLLIRNAADSGHADLECSALKAASLELMGSGENGKITYGPNALIPSSGEGFLIKSDDGGDFEDLVAKRLIISNYESIALAQEATSKKYVDDAIAASFGANDAMVFIGTLGTGGTITTPETFDDLTGYSAGWTYRVITAGTWAGKVCEVGDLVICVTDYVDTWSNDHWIVAQTNIDGAITIDPDADGANGELVVFSGASGKMVKQLDSGSNGQILKIVSNVPAWADESPGFINPMSALGDIIIGSDASGTADRLAAGEEGKVLKIGSSGLPEWGTDSSYTHPNHSGDVTSVGDGAQTISAGAVTLAKMANLTAKTIIGNNTGSATTPIALTVAQTSGLLHGDDAPTNYDSEGVKGEIRFDANYAYFCVVGGNQGTARWKRSPVASLWSASAGG